jgi:hypothetical protein
MGSTVHDKKDWFERDLEAISKTNGFLSPLSFRYLEQIRGKPLEIPFLHALSLNLALPLAGHFGPLILDGLTALTPPVARALASHGGVLSLNGLKELDSSCAMFLKNHEGPLQLSGLLELPQNTAKLLAEHRGDLQLNGLITLSDESALALADHRGSLCLDRLGVFSDRAAYALSTHEGDLSLHALAEYSLHQPLYGEGFASLLRRIRPQDSTSPRTPMTTIASLTPQNHGAELLDQALSFSEEPLEDPFTPRFGW